MPGVPLDATPRAAGCRRAIVVHAHLGRRTGDGRGCPGWNADQDSQDQEKEIRMYINSPGGDMTAQLVALKELQAWDRDAFIEKGGWAKMPDRAEPTKRAATLCAAELVALDVPPTAATVVPQ